MVGCHEQGYAIKYCNTIAFTQQKLNIFWPAE